MSSRSAIAAGAVFSAVAATLFCLRPTVAQPAGGGAPLLLRYSFQPECLLHKDPQAPCGTPRTNKRLDLGPQIAVWLEKADGSFVDTLMVTNATAVRGIGNRPGYWRFPSNWHFPYGKRTMVLPVWAHARGKTYETLVIQDDDGTNSRDMGLGFHESVSSPDPYYCLTFRPASWVFEVDEITCPTSMFNSSKGRFDPKLPKSYYPPRNDLTTFSPNDCDIAGSGSSCPRISARQFADLNDLDAVASATPPYGAPTSRTWLVPADLPEGAYRLAVEVNKEFDSNGAHAHEAFQDPLLAENGLRDNIGQPSVVWKVPFQLDRNKLTQAAVTEITGYGDWDGATGTLHAPDSTISDAPGSGMGRLLVFARPSTSGGEPLKGRVHLSTELAVGPAECQSLPTDNGVISALEVPPLNVTDHKATVELTEPADRGQAVAQYEIRYVEGSHLTPETFPHATSVATLVPQAPGARRSVYLTDLRANTTYTVGARVRGGCVNVGPLAQATFTTRTPMFKQLSGCFVATAAYGSALDPHVALLRRVRDRARAGSAFAAATIGLYERSSPPLANVLRESDTGRALVRTALAPLLNIAGRLETLIPALSK